MLWDELNFKLLMYGSKGGKTSRGRQIERVRMLLAFCRAKGVRGPDQIGRRHVFEWYEESLLADRTLSDRYYAAQLLWELLGRGEAPRPRLIKGAPCHLPGA